MARARVTISLTPHELAFVADAMRVYYEVIAADLGITGPTEVQFNDAVCNGNWHMGLIKVEEIRSQLGDGEMPVPDIRPRQAAAAAPRKRKGRSAVSQARRANRTGRKVLRFLGV